MIESFGNKATEDLFHGRQTARVRKLPHDVLDGALLKLDMINAAHEVNDLKVPPGNRLEALKGNLIGFYSIRVNSQWRIVFRWQGISAYDVRLTDYHR